MSDSGVDTQLELPRLCTAHAESPQTPLIQRDSLTTQLRGHQASGSQLWPLGIPWGCE